MSDSNSPIATRRELADAGAERIRPTRSPTALRPGPGGVRGRLRALLRRAAGIDPHHADEAWEETLVRLFGRSRTTVDNAITVLGDGDAWFDRLDRDFDAARREIVVESYIVRDDDTGRRVRERLVAAAQRGVEVTLVLDAIGGAGVLAAGTLSTYLRPLLEAGVRVGVYNPPWRWFKHGPFRRSHRKLVLVDGRIAHVGGMNIGDEYAARRSGDAAFEDLHLRITGPAAAMLRDRSLRLVGAERTSLPTRGDGVAHDAGDVAARNAVVQILETDGAAGRREIQAAMRVVIAGARRSVDIATPYFVPPGGLITALLAARRRGVRVRLLTAGLSDVPMVTLAARHVYGRLLDGGIEVHELHDRTLHAKALVVDDEYALVGSFNLDQWSHRRNLELNVGIVDRETVTTIDAWIEARIARSERIDAATHGRRPWWKRLLHFAAWEAMRL